MIVAHVVTWNSAATIEKCLESLLAQSRITLGEDFLIYVTDNASADNTAELVRSRFGDTQGVTFVTELTNTGFAGGHNLGIERALEQGAKYYAAINPDVALEPATLSRLVEVLEADSRCGAIAPRMLRADESLCPVSPPRFDSTGMYVTPSVRHFDRASEEPTTAPDGSLRFNRAEYVFGISGAVAMYTRDFLLDVALPAPSGSRVSRQVFDETFFAYREDADLSWRGQRLGWRFRYEPSVTASHVRHVLPERRAQLSPTINALGVKNRFLLLANHLSWNQPWAYHPALWLRNFLVIGAVLLRERSSFPALRSAYQLLPQARRRFAAVEHRRRVRGATLARWFRKEPSSLPALSDRRPEQVLRSLTIIVVNYNSGARLAKCLRHLHTVAVELVGTINCEVVVIDNASTDDSATRLQQIVTQLPHFHLELSPKNLGFAGAINLAASRSPGDALLILNPDVELEAPSVAALIHALDTYADLGAVAPILHDEDGRPQHGFIARSFPSLGSTLAELFFLHRLWPTNPWTSEYLRKHDRFLLRYVRRRRAPRGVPTENLSRPLLVDQPPGACLLIRKTDFDRIGGMDAGFWPAWFEDVDLCKRLSLQLEGNERTAACALVNDASVLHEGGYSKQQIGSSRFATIWYPNLLRYWWIHGTAAQFTLLRVLLPLALFLRGTAAAVQGAIVHFRRRSGGERTTFISTGILEPATAESADHRDSLSESAPVAPSGNGHGALGCATHDAIEMAIHPDIEVDPEIGHVVGRIDGDRSSDSEPIGDEYSSANSSETLLMYSRTLFRLAFSPEKLLGSEPIRGPQPQRRAILSPAAEQPEEGRTGGAHTLK